MVGVFHLCLIAGSLTLYESYHLLAASGFHAHDSRDLLSYRSAAYRTSVGRSLSLCDGLCQTVAARVSAAAAVVAWKGLADSSLFFVYLNLKLFTEESQTDTYDDTGSCDYNGCYNNCCNIHFRILPLQ